MKIKRIPVDFASQQMSSSLAAYVTLPAAPWEEADDIRSPRQRALDMKRAGKTYVEIGEALGVSAGAVQHSIGGR